MTALTQSKAVRDVVPAPSSEPRIPFGELEGPLSDADNMAGILADMVEELVTRERDPHVPSHIYCPAPDRDKLAFAAHNASERLSRLRLQYYGLLQREVAPKEHGDKALSTGWEAAQWLPFDAVLFLNIAAQCRAPVSLAPRGVVYSEPEQPSPVYEFIRGWHNNSKDSARAVADTLRRRPSIRAAHERLLKEVSRLRSRGKKGGDA